jgi:hypothetical protein
MPPPLLPEPDADNLQFYQMTLVMVKTFLMCGNFPQADLAFSHMATIAISRFSMIKFASDMGHIRLALAQRWHGGYVVGRAEPIYYLFVAHIQMPLQDMIPHLEGGLEISMQAGDRISTLVNFGVVANLKLFASEHLADLEAFCTYGCEEIPHWEHDLRGSTMIIAVKQVARALQGKVGRFLTWVAF